MKKVLKTVIATVFVFLFSGSIAEVYSGEWIEKTVVEKEFQVNKDANLIIDHEYGEVSCVNWDKNSISVVVTVKLDADNQEEADKIMNDIDIDVKGNDSKVEVFCNLDQKYKKKNNRITIDVYIKMPETVNLFLESGFGTVEIETVSGTSEISCKYGSLNVNSLVGKDNNIELAFGAGEIGYLSTGKLEVSYSKLSVNGAEELSVESEYSDFSLEKITNISLECEGGNAVIGSVASAEIESEFSNVEIGELSNNIVAETEYGSLIVKYISDSFSRIEVENSFGAVELAIDDKASYNIDASGKYCHISYPEENAKLSYRKVGKGSTELKGIIGKNSSPKSDVILTSDYGAIELVNK